MITASDILELGSGQKVILLMEVAPLTDKFAQIMLTREEFTAMRQGLWNAAPASEEGPEYRTITTSERYTDISIPDIPSLYTVEEKAK